MQHRVLFVCFSLCSLGGCTGGMTSVDAAEDSATDAAEVVSIDAQCATVPTLESGDASGAAEPFRAPAGSARAGRLTAGNLPEDPTGLATWAVGDYVLANDRVALLVEGVRASSGNDPWGGKPIGVALVRDGRPVLAGDFSELLLLLARHTIRTERVTVLRDGMAGGRAVLRAEGPLAPQPFFEELARALLPGEHGDLRAAIDYELAGNSDVVELFVSIVSSRPVPSRLRSVGLAFFQRERMPLFLPTQGFAQELGSSLLPWIGYVFDRGASYAWLPPMGTLSPFLSVSGFDSFMQTPQDLGACGTTRFPLGRMLIAGPGVDALQSAIARIENRTLRSLQGQVLDADGTPAAGVHVHATNANATTYHTRATTDAMGMFSLQVPAMETVQLHTWRTGNAPVRSASIAPGTNTAMLRLEATGTVRVRVTAGGTPLPARVQLQPLDGTAPAPPTSFGEALPEGAMHLTFPSDGEVVLRAPPGRYRAVISRGFEYTLVEREVRVEAAQEQVVQAELSRVVQTEGAVCGDFHVHTHRSFDASDDARFKLRSLIAEGVELAVRSDHEFVADFEPLLNELGLQRWALGIPSLELTTVGWGHFGVFPLPVANDAPNGGAFVWTGKTPQEVFRSVRAHPAQPTIIINHPTVGPPGGTYFVAANFDRARGVGTRPNFWDTEFTAVEVFNDTDFEANRNQSVADWFALLRAGRRVFAVGSSDSHHILRNMPVGYPRTCVFVGTDDPRATNANAVRDAVARGRSTIFGGVYVTLRETTSGVSHGETAMGVGARASIEVTVRAAPWVAVDRLELLVDGATMQTLPINASTVDPMNPTVRLRTTVMVPVAEAGSWIVAAAHGTAGQTLAPLYPMRRAFGATNPIFLRR